MQAEYDSISKEKSKTATEKERNAWELKRDNLKGLARFTKKGELQSKIDRKNEEIDILKIGLSGIIRKHGFAIAQNFYTALRTSQNAFYKYQKERAKGDETHGGKVPPRVETFHERLQQYQQEAKRHNLGQAYTTKDKGAR